MTMNSYKILRPIAHLGALTPLALMVIDYFTGNYDGSDARGLPFGMNSKTGDARIAGSLASLVGLESALAANDPEKTETAINPVAGIAELLAARSLIDDIYISDELKDYIVD